MGPARERDHLGRPLPVWRGGLLLLPGEVFLLNWYEPGSLQGATLAPFRSKRASAARSRYGGGRTIDARSFHPFVRPDWRDQLCSCGVADVRSGRIPDKPTASRATTNVVANAMQEASRRFHIPVAWLRAVTRAESDVDAKSVSDKGAIGLMQVMPATYEELRVKHGLGPDPSDPHDKILTGAAYLTETFGRYGPSGSLAAYNAGPRRYEQHLRGRRPLPSETVDTSPACRRGSVSMGRRGQQPRQSTRWSRRYFSPRWCQKRPPAWCPAMVRAAEWLRSILSSRHIPATRFSRTKRLRLARGAHQKQSPRRGPPAFSSRVPSSEQAHDGFRTLAHVGVVSRTFAREPSGESASDR
jgi:hypothetical protein